MNPFEAKTFANSLVIAIVVAFAICVAIVPALVLSASAATYFLWVGAMAATIPRRAGVLTARACHVALRLTTKRTIAICAALLFAFFIWPTPYQYFHEKSGSTIIIYRINRFTGTAEVLQRISSSSAVPIVPYRTYPIRRSTKVRY